MKSEHFEFVSQTSKSSEVAGKKAHEEALLKLLEQTRLRPDEVSTYFEYALSRSYWQSLCPHLSLSDASPNDSLETESIDAEHREFLLKKFTREGYFQTEPLFSAATVRRMAEGLEVLRGADWPPVFSFVYDEFWGITRGAGLGGTLSTILGPEYQQMPHIWSHYVHPSRGAGWRPHIDGYRTTNRVTVWVALSDATLDNGCIYLIPKNMAPAEIARDFPKLEALSISDAKVLLQSSRALPVAAGSILCWGHNVIHWRAACNSSPEPRISISQEFIGRGESTTDADTPLLDAHRLPTFAERLHVIARAVVAYQRFEPLTVRYLDLAELLLERVAIG
jgi:Phytanoyl-CoA dioxygenase (PhyH)